MLGKYYNLYQYLNNKTEDELTLSFDDIENILGFKLPKYLYSYKAGWLGFAEFSPTHVQKKAWEEAGYTVKYCDLNNKEVTFVKLKDKSIETSKPRTHKNRKLEVIETINATSDEIEKVHQEVENTFNYGKEGQIINEVFNKFSLNNDIAIIAMKIAVIDTTNSTNLSRYKSKISLYDLASIILNIKDFDERVKNGCPELVNEIAGTSKSKYGINLFSFASKYCCYHNKEVYGKDDYSIYDSYLEENLSKYIPNTSKTSIHKYKENIDYKSYNDTIGDYLDNNDINIPFRRRKFDHFVWYKGKTNQDK